MRVGSLLDDLIRPDQRHLGWDGWRESSRGPLPEELGRVGRGRLLDSPALPSLLSEPGREDAEWREPRFNVVTLAGSV